MPTRHPVLEQAVNQGHPFVYVVTGSSTGLKGQSSSSESARSTTTPGWRHYVGRWCGMSHGLLCKYVQGGNDDIYAHNIFGPRASREGK